MTPPLIQLIYVLVNIMNASDDDYELIDVRLGEQLPITRLEPWVRENLNFSKFIFSC